MQRIKQHPVIAAGILVVIVAVIAFIVAVWKFGWDWTGFTAGASKITITRTSNGTTTATELQPARTLWDWLGLLAALAIPVVVGLGAAWFTSQQGKVSDAENTDNQRENALQAYIDKISDLLLHERLSELLLDEHVSESPGDIQVVIIARARTATVLRVLDQGRRGSLIRFLSQAGILTKCIEDELRGIDLHGADLTWVNLSGINLSTTNLRGADLSYANLKGTKLILAKLSGGNLINTDLSGADLSQADLSGAFLSVANLYGADLYGADLHRAFLSAASLHGADLTGADLAGADLSGADLSNAKVANKQLDAAKTLKGATMPDGSIHP